MASNSLTKLHPTAHRGIGYKLNAAGKRRYYVYYKGRLISTAEDGSPLTLLDQAIERKGQLTGHGRRGEEVRSPEKITFQAASEAWLQHALSRPRKPLSEDTAREYQRFLDNVLIPRFGPRLIGSIRAEEIEALTIELLKKHNSESAAANTLKPLRGTFRFAQREKKWISRNPCEEISDSYRISCNATREHREWTSAEVDRLIRVGHERDTRPEARQDYGLGIEVKLRLGLRLGELLGLRYRDIALEDVSGEKRAVVTVQRQWTKSGQIKERTKGKVGSRRVPLTLALHKKIAERKLRLGAGDEDFVFASKRGGRPPQQGNFRKRGWYPAVEQAGLVVEDGVRVTPHDARHAAVSQWAALGLTPADVAPVVGHASAQVTEQVYLHVFDRAAREEKARQAMALAEGASS